MTPIVFLDMDGVVNSHEYFLSLDQAVDDSALRYSREIDPAAVHHLNAIARASGAEVVISSSWRIVRAREAIKLALRARGFEFSNRIIGETGYRNDGDGTCRRGLEIQDWLNAHRPSGVPFVILDDSSDMGNLLPKLVQTTYQHGLQAHHVPLALKVLGL